MKRFNTTGKCNPQMHYMVNIDVQVEAAAKLVRQGDYFCVNRGRQYGKTTTLAALKKKLEGEGYIVFSISFEGLSDSVFETTERLLQYTLLLMADCVRWKETVLVDNNVQDLLNTLRNNRGSAISLYDALNAFYDICTNGKVVLLIDEVDQASNYPSFLKFLGLLRDMFLKRDTRPTFQSVILAGVYDIKNLKLKVRPEEMHQHNSPWNIAVSYNTEMSLSEQGISDMLVEYKTERNVEFDNEYVAKSIYSYTSGYPFLVSRLCQIIDENEYSWDKEGVLKSVNTILKEENTLFDDLVRKLSQFPTMKDLIKQILYLGVKKSYSIDEQNTQLARRFNFLTEKDGFVKISCRLFETRMYNLFLCEAENDRMYTNGQLDKNQFIHDGIIDMRHLLERFSVHFNDIFRTADGSMDQEFVENQGRKQFLLYLRPIINGKGNYYVEAETRDETRTDVVVDYLGQQYIIEMKIWHGNSYNERGEQQLKEYLDFYHQKKGYMLSFCFNKGKTPGVHTVSVEDYELVEAIV